MPNLFGNYQAAKDQGGYIVNRMALPSTQVQATTPLTYTGTVAGDAASPPTENPLARAGMFLAAAPVDVIDGFGAVMGQERGSINRSVWQGLGQYGFADWVDQNQQGVEATSGVLGSMAVGIGAEMASTRLLTSGWMAATGMGRFLAPVIQGVGRAEQAATDASLEAAMAGRVLPVWSNPLRPNANMALINWKVGTGLGKAAVSEAAVAATMNKNSAVWSDDMSQNLMFGALGLAIGSGLGAVEARGSIYRWANSDEMRLARADVADPGGYLRLLTDNPIGAIQGNGTFVTKPSAEITDLALDIRRDDALATPGTIGPSKPTTQRSGIQLQLNNLMRDKLQQWTSKGLPGSQAASRFLIKTADAGSAGNHVLEAIDRDPSVMFGAADIGQLPYGTAPKDATAKYYETADSLLKQKKQTAKLQGAQMKQRQGLVLIHGTWMSPDDAELFTAYKPDTAAFAISPSGQMEYKAVYSGKKYKIGEDGRVSGGHFQDIPIPDMLGIREGMTKLMTNMQARKLVVTIPKDAEAHQIDFAMQYESMGGKVDYKNLGPGATRDTAQIKALQLKYAGTKRYTELGPKQRYALNLPMPTAHERISDPTSIVMRNWLGQSLGEGIDTTTMRTLRMQSNKLGGIATDTENVNALDGGAFGFNRSKSSPTGKWMTPVLAFFDDTPAAKWSRFEMADQITETKTAKVSVLASTKSAPTTALITQRIMNHPLFQKAMDVLSLDDSQLSATANALNSSASAMLTQAMRFRNSPVMQAAQDIRRVVNRITANRLDGVYANLRPLTDQINAPGAAKSKILFNQYYSNAAGWDIAQATTLPDGTTAFALRADSAKNAKRLKRPVKPGELLSNERTGAPIILDSLSNQLRMSVETEMTALLRERNAVRTARGLTPINHQPFFIAPQNIKGKSVGFTLDEFGKPVHGGAIIADTPAQYESMRARLQAEWDKTNPGYTVYSADHLRSDRDMWERAELDFIDPTHMAAPSGMGSATLASRNINPHNMQDIIDYLKRGYEQNSNGTVGLLFDSQLGIVNMRDAAQKSLAKGSPDTKNIWETYKETLMGIPSNVNPSGVTEAALKLDKRIDNITALVWPAVTAPMGWLNGVLQTVGYASGKIRGKPVNLARVKTFEDLATELGPYMPFKTAMDYAQYTHGISVPPTMKEMSRFVNRLGAGILLRWGEIPQAAMNMTGIITNMPGLVNNGRVPIMGRVQGANIIDSMAIMAKGTKRMLARHAGADWDYMVESGDASQTFAEYHKSMSLVKDHGSFMRVMTGNPAIKYDHLPLLSKERAQAFLKNKGVEGMVSYATDTSESLSRVWAHFIGLELADYHGIVGMDARHLFARQTANDAIANYDPLNRPEVFNSGVGSLYGLFLSYSQNYYQRMFRWLEDGQYAQVGHSLATQASMFGLAGTPGWNQMAALHDWFTNNEGSEGHGLLEGIYSRYGAQVGNVVAHGGFDQLVTLLGLPGIAFHSRGDQNFRNPASDFLTSGLQVPTPPGIEVLKDLIESTSKAMGELAFHRDTTSSQYLAEIMARQMPNRMLHGALTVLAAGGTDADVNGNVMAETQGMVESVYRFLGLRSTRQQSEIDAYFLNQKSLQVDAARLAPLRERTRALVRSGEYDKLPAIFDNYLKVGGKPWNYAPWIRSIVTEANNTRTQNQLLQSLRSPTHQELARRIELFTGGL